MSDTTASEYLGGGVSTITAVPDTAAPSAPGAADIAADAATQAKDVSGAGLDQAKAVAVDAKDQATELAAQVGDQAKKAVAMTKDELRVLADDRSQQLCQGLRSLSGQLGAISTGDSGGVVEDVGRDVGQRIGSIADRLEQDGLDGAMRQVTSLAQRRPGMFLLGAVAAGFLAARVLRDTKDIVSDAAPSTDEPAIGTATGPAVGPAVTAPFMPDGVAPVGAF